MASETTGLVSGSRPKTNKSIGYIVDIELLRAYGLFAGVILLIVGRHVTLTYVRFPGDDSFDGTKTFIYRLFHFNHTCSYLDFNPSKTVAALVLMLHTIPMNIFVILSHLKLVYEYENEINGVTSLLRWFSTITTPMIFIFFTYFYLVFVNSPDSDSMVDFVLHYIPYMCWQSGMILMAIRQIAYLIGKEKVGTFTGISSSLLRGYCLFLIALFIYYTVFVWSFIFGSPILDTTVPWKRNIGIAIMFGFDIFAVLVPMIFAFIQSYKGKSDAFFVMQFHNVESKEEGSGIINSLPSPGA